MKSSVQVKGHPIHPILVSFPITCFIGTFLFDVLGMANQRIAFHETAYYLSIGGLGFGLLAAVPGFLDFLKTVPPESSGKKRAAKHGLINATVLLIFLTALMMRNENYVPTLFVTGLEAIGVVLLSIAGWLGGTLVYRNQIGVDIRYANAGKWKEERKPLGSGSIEVGRSAELKDNQMKLIRIGEKRIVICKSDKGFVAFDDRCTHRGGSLAGGVLICGTVQCPWHGSQFNVYSGAVHAGPAKERINYYPITESQGKLFIDLKD